jgi:uncharacterized membrane protein (DUF485 family)
MEAAQLPASQGGIWPSNSVYQQIRVNPKFRELELQRSRLAWLLSAIVLAAYYGLMIVVAFFPSWLHAPLSQDRVITIGVPIAAAVILLSWLLTGLYVYRANTAFDDLNEAILNEVRQ